MSDAPFIGSNGLIADVSFNGNGPQNGFANISPGQVPNGTTDGPGPWVASQHLPGANVQLVGAGQYNIPSGVSSQLAIGQGTSTRVLGIRGSMQVDVVTGNGTGSQGLAYLVGSVGPTFTQVLGLSLGGSNVPTVYITDVDGTEVVGSGGTALANSTPVQLRLYWDASIGTTVLTVNGTTANLGISPTPWTPFVPVAILYGQVPPSFAGNGALFNGRFAKLQVSPNPGLAG